MPRQFSPSLTRPVYFIKADYGKLGSAWVERDANETDRETTITDLLRAQIDRPLEVWCADDGCWTDVSEDIAREIAGRSQRDPLPQPLIDFIHDHAGAALARELRAA